MEIKIAGYTIDLYNHVSINLKYNSVASTFSFKLFFDPNNPSHKEIFRPGAYHKCTITHGGVLLLTGNVLSVRFYSAGEPPRQLVDISGYSKTGVLEDCPLVLDNLQQNGLTIKHLAEFACKHYDIDVYIDPEVTEECDTVIPISRPDKDESVREYLDKLCSHVNVILSHLPDGRLFLTKVKSGKKLTNSGTIVNTSPTPFTNEVAGAPQTQVTQPKIVSSRATLCDLTADNRISKGSKTTLWTNMSLSFDGQRIHSDIIVCAPTDGTDTPNNVQSNPLFNPYFDDSGLGNLNQFVLTQTAEKVRGARPLTVIQQNQTANSDNKVEKTARSVLGDELKNITLSVEFDRWVVNRHLVTPNQMISVVNSDVYLYQRLTTNEKGETVKGKPVEWFIQDVNLIGDEKQETAFIVCVPPSAFGSDEVTNNFK